MRNIAEMRTDYFSIRQKQCREQIRKVAYVFIEASFAWTAWPGTRRRHDVAEQVGLGERRVGWREGVRFLDLFELVSVDWRDEGTDRPMQHHVASEFFHDHSRNTVAGALLQQTTRRLSQRTPKCDFDSVFGFVGSILNDSAKLIGMAETSVRQTKACNLKIKHNECKHTWQYPSIAQYICENTLHTLINNIWGSLRREEKRYHNKGQGIESKSLTLLCFFNS